MLLLEDLVAYTAAAALADELHRETRHWIARAQARGLLAQGYGEQLEEIGRALNGLIATQRARRA